MEREDAKQWILNRKRGHRKPKREKRYGFWLEKWIRMGMKGNERRKSKREKEYNFEWREKRGVI